MFQVKHILCPEITSNILCKVHTITCKSVYHETESITYLELKIWNIALEEIKQKNFLNSFTEYIKMWLYYNKLSLQTLQSLYRWSWFYQYHLK